MSGPIRTLAADKAEFIGRNGQLAKPAALSRLWRSGAMEASLEPCAAMQRSFDLAAGQSIEINILLGHGAQRQGSCRTGQALPRRRRHPASREGTPWTVFRYKHPTRRWTFWPPDGWSIKYSPVGCGDAAAITSPGTVPPLWVRRSECRIDSICQIWAVLAGEAMPSALLFARRC